MVHPSLLVRVAIRRKTGQSPNWKVRKLPNKKNLRREYMKIIIDFRLWNINSVTCFIFEEKSAIQGSQTVWDQ